MLRSLSFILVMLGAGQLFSQPRNAEEAAYDSAYAVRIKLDEINGVYIPSNLQDAFVELKRLSSPADIDKFRQATEEIVRTKLHFSLGKWMIVNWGFYEGSRLSHLLKAAGLQHPDDMARVLLVCFHRHLNGRELKFEEEVAFYKAFREQEKAAQEAEKEVISVEKAQKKD